MNATDAREVTVVVHDKGRERPSSTETPWGERLANIGTGVLRYGLVFLLLVIGSMKFFDFEAKGIQPLVAHSLFLSWMYRVLSIQGVSNVFGLFEITTGILIALRQFSPKASAIGSLAGIVIFLTTLSFLFTTPGALAPGSDIGGFLMKDIILLGAAILTAGEALRASKSSRMGRWSTAQERGTHDDSFRSQACCAVGSARGLGRLIWARVRGRGARPRPS